MLLLLPPPCPLPAAAPAAAAPAAAAPTAAAALTTSTAASPSLADLVDGKSMKAHLTLPPEISGYKLSAVAGWGQGFGLDLEAFHSDSKNDVPR